MAADKPAKKPRPLTLKQKKLVKGIAEGKTQRQAAKDAGLHETYASNILKEPKVQASIQDLMDKMGLSNKTLLIKHKELLHAQKQIPTEKEPIEAPDYMTQMKALESAYKLKGAYVEKIDQTSTVTHTVTYLHPEDRYT